MKVEKVILLHSEFTKGSKLNAIDLFVSSVNGGDLSGSTGEIYSPNYPDQYADGLSVTWTITVDPSYLILITIVDVEIEGSGISCPYDYLRVSNRSSCRDLLHDGGLYSLVFQGSTHLDNFPLDNLPERLFSDLFPVYNSHSLQLFLLTSPPRQLPTVTTT